MHTKPRAKLKKSLTSPWWDWCASEVILPEFLGGKTMTIEELTSRMPVYPDGRRPKAITVSRRLSHVLDLVERGPNDSKSVGAIYRVKMLVEKTEDTLTTDDEWLEQAAIFKTGDK